MRVGDRAAALQLACVELALLPCPRLCGLAFDPLALLAAQALARGVGASGLLAFGGEAPLPLAREPLQPLGLDLGGALLLAQLRLCALAQLGLRALAALALLALGALAALGGAAGAAVVVVAGARVEGLSADLERQIVVAVAAPQVAGLGPRVEGVGVLAALGVGRVSALPPIGIGGIGRPRGRRLS